MHPAFQHLQRLVVFTLLAVVAATTGIMFVPAAPAHADEGGGWCAVDPILSVNGRTVSIAASVMGTPADVRANVSHAYFKIFLPYGVDARIVGYTGDYFAESAEIMRDGTLAYVPGRAIEMKVEVEFWATATMPARLAALVSGSPQHVMGSGTTSTGVRGRYLLRP